jgi:pyruvate dehydrogenase E1 component
MLHPAEKPRKPYITAILEKEEGPFVAASDYLKVMPDQVSRWVPGGLYGLGTDGFGRSDTREALRRFFEVDAESIVIAVLYRLAQQGKIKAEQVAKAMKELGLDPEKANPMIS